MKNVQECFTYQKTIGNRPIYVKTLLLSFFSVISLFLLIFEVPILKFSLIHIFAFFSIIYLIKNNLVLDKKIISLLVLYTVLFVFLLINAFFTAGSISLIYDQVIKVVEVIIFSYVFVDFMKKNNIGSEKLVSFFIVISSLQAVIALLSLIFPGFREQIVNFMFSNFYFEKMEVVQYRVYGLGVNFLYTLPIFQSIMAIICIKRFYEDNILYLFLSIFIAISAVINARTALVIYAIGVVCVILSSKVLLKGKFFMAKTLFLALTFCLFITVIWSSLEDIAPETYIWVNEAVKEILLFFDGEKVGFFINIVGTKKTFTLTAAQSLFGVGQFVMGNPYLGYSTDIGYINYFYLGGLFYSILLYSIYLFIIFKIYKSNKKNRIYALIFAMTFLIANYKGQAFCANELTYSLFLLYFMCTNNSKGVNDNGKQNINNSSCI